MSCHWNPTKEEIEEWLDKKLHEFVTQENKTLQISMKRWLDRYIYTEIHEILFASFLSELYNWIARLSDSGGRYNLDQLIVWTPKLVCRLEASKDKVARPVDHWLNRINRRIYH